MVKFRFAEKGKELYLAKQRLAFLKAVSGDSVSERPSKIGQLLVSYFKDALAEETCRCVIAEAEGKTVGQGTTFFYRSVPSFHNPKGINAYITSVFVEPGWRWRGIAARILSLLEAEAEKRGCRGVLLHPSKEGEALYSALSFEFCSPLMMLNVKEELLSCWKQSVFSCGR